MLSERIRSFDWVAALATILLIMLGLVMLFSTTSESTLVSPLFRRQVASLAIALSGYILVSLIPYHYLSRYVPVLYGAGLVGLMIVSQIGRVIRGTTSRLEILGVQVQPSEFMKIGVILLLAWLFMTPGAARRWGRVVFSGVLVGLAVALIVLEPDIGVAGLILMVWLTMVVFLGTSWWLVGIITLAGLAAAAGAWRWLLIDFQRARILTFLNPASDPLGAGYNVVQSIVALGSGSWFGKGLGHGPQSQLQFLPEQHTDFIMASLGEELGFIGIVLLVVLYVVLLWRVLRVARITRDQFGRNVAVGTYVLLLFSFIISTGMNIGLLPVTGIPLPLISYGGSNLVSTLILLGIVQSVHIHNRWVREPPAELMYLS